ncbi:unnamed protein product [Tetraodon nigroviridis]|uniref:(spotted green pufferfish) hypothetical protein n=1 Tax=Tetraodon nigroviridis TaxID=99883 RepID=Q4SJN4_TETNG|nr:unnamed protein product [Tetraodon nigroviridis]
MDSWTLQGDSYSFLRSAPPALSLCHRDGTPNHVEIFDIISVPHQRTAISETTCLCDIFGDDTEPPSLSIVGPLVPPQGEADGIVASLVADDLNDSSGSYHSAQGFSEGEEGFEDSRERLCSPPRQGELSQRTQPEETRHPKNPTDSSTNAEPESRPPSSSNNTGPTLGVLDGTERAPSPGHSSQYPLEGRASSSSPPLVEETFSPVPPNPGKEAELRTNPLSFRKSSPSHQALTPRPNPESCVTPEPPQSKSPESSSTFSKEDIFSEPRSTCFVHHRSPSPEPTSRDFPLGFTQSTFGAGAIVPSPLSSDTDISQRLGTQLEIDREMQMEEVGEVGRERLMERRMEKHGEGEEQLPEKGKGWPENAGYREEQVELSFRSRNRKGSLSGRAVTQADKRARDCQQCILIPKLAFQQTAKATTEGHICFPVGELGRRS